MMLRRRFQLEARRGIIPFESAGMIDQEESPMTIKAILESKTRNIVSVSADISLREAVALLARERIGAVPVTADGVVTGIVSERDVIYCLEAKGSAALDLPVSAVMTSPAITIEPEVSVLVALSQMSRRRIRHLPVLDGGTLVGIVSIGDLVAYRIRHIEQEAEAMRSYIQGA